MKTAGLKILNNKLSEYLRLAASGETMLVTDRDRVVAELNHPQPGRKDFMSDPVSPTRHSRKVPDLPTVSDLLPPPHPAVMTWTNCWRIWGATGRLMIYLDSSVVLARLVSESRLPDDSWRLRLISSRFLQYEV